MALSGTYTFDPTIAEMLDEAFERFGVDTSKLNELQIRSALRSVQFMFSSWSNKDNPEWANEQEVQALTQGDESYPMPTGAIAVTSMVMRSTTGSDTFDTEMYNISRKDYLKIADKDIQGRPTQYFMDRERTVPTLYLWNSPENSTDSIVYNYVRRLQDVDALVQTPDIPYRWFDAMAAGLAARLYPKFWELSGRPHSETTETRLENKAEISYKEAAYEDSDKSPTSMRVSFTKTRRRR